MRIITISVIFLLLSISVFAVGENVKMKIIGVYPIKAKQPVHMIEILIENSKEKFDLSLITQEVPGQPRLNWQVPYMEHILNQDGTKLLADTYEAMTKPELWKGNLRMVFFFHYLDTHKPINTPWGKIDIPEVTKQPVRIKIKYEEP